jgi:uncharacterized protein YbjQ (UPF0145 family)
MRNTKDILVSTTSSIDGINVVEYIKPISAHVVAGTDFFSDFFASFSDFFGGRSQTYQKQLSSIYSEAIDNLKRNAYEIGANCILGLRVDMDEISGKNKSMFMITAIGTAVIIEIPSKTKKTIDNLNAISLDKMIDLRKRDNYINSAHEGILILNDATWDFLTINSVDEIAVNILDIIKTNDYYDTEKRKKTFQQVTSYFLTIDEDKKINVLYEYYMNNELEYFSEFIYDLINELAIFNVEKLLEYLTLEDPKKKQRALKLVIVDKPYFTIDDIPDFLKLESSIKSNFNENGEVQIVKSKLTSKEKEIWRCKCGNSNNIDAHRCGCGLDRMGFYEGEITSKYAIDKLYANIDLIQRVLMKK